MIPVQIGQCQLHLKIGPDGFSRNGFLMAWGVSMAGIITDMYTKLDPCQYRLATEIIQRWATTLGYTIGPDEPPQVFLQNEVKKLRDVFENVRRTASLTRVFRGTLSHANQNCDRDEELIEKTREFCDAEIAEIDRLKGMGDVTCERWVFWNLISHLMDLLRVVLGDTHLERFAVAYDEAIGALREAHDLSRAPISS